MISNKMTFEPVNLFIIIVWQLETLKVNLGAWQVPIKLVTGV